MWDAKSPSLPSTGGKSEGPFLSMEIVNTYSIYIAYISSSFIQPFCYHSYTDTVLRAFPLSTQILNGFLENLT